MYPHHGAVFGRVLMDDLERVGFPPEVLLSGLDLRPEDLRRENAMIPFNKLAALFERAADLTGDDLLGFNRGIRRRFQRVGALAYVGLSAPTMRDMLKNTARYSQVFSDAVEVDVRQLDETGDLRWYFDVPAHVKRRQYVEFGAVGIVVAQRQFTNREFALKGVRISHPRNYGIRKFDQFFGCETVFGAHENVLTFRQEDLDLPLMTRDEDLLTVLRRHCHDILTRKDKKRSSLETRLERAIVDRLANGSAKQEALATDLGMSSRSLSRHLAEEHTSFQQVLDGLRQALADRYLRHSNLSQSEIAFLLGYASLSSFSTAYRRWTGHPPGDTRRHPTV